MQDAPYAMSNLAALSSAYFLREFFQKPQGIINPLVVCVLTRLRGSKLQIK